MSKASIAVCLEGAPSVRARFESNKEDIDSVPWAFISFPGIAFKDEAGSALLDYAQGTIPWSEAADRIRTAYKKAKAQ